jgi:LPXTG-motif cell wall-anchored protein
MSKLLIVIGLAALFLCACATGDKALLKPKLDEAGAQVYAHVETGAEISKAEYDALPEADAQNFEPVYTGPKTKADFEQTGFSGEVLGVSIAGTLALAAAAWWAVRRKRKVVKPSNA